MTDTAVAKKTYFRGTGRRKSAVAQVRLAPGTGKVSVNKRELKDYFVREQDRQIALGPLMEVKSPGEIDVIVRAAGGGYSGQAGATCLGVARALLKMDPDLESTLRKGGHLTRDSRMKERKKYGLRGARRAFQFSKR